ncbi:hypothetical protein [Dyella sp.]|uniref:hypothetical protein n=1 Tax=Dyella sp. TaxID=1869338 RepID=UPI002ED557F1
MRCPTIVFASLALVVSLQGAHAQSASQASDTWSRPASSSTVQYGQGNRNAGAAQDSHFKFKSITPHVNDTGRPDPNRPTAINDNSRILDDNGRPAASCASDPRQPKCH